MAERTGATAGLIGIYGSNAPALVWGGNTDRLRFAQVDDTSLTNFTERMTIDSSGNVGVGTSSPSNKLSVSDATNAFIAVTNTTASKTSYIGTTTAGDFEVNASAASANAIFKTVGSEAMRINSSGKVGINTNSSTGDQRLEVRSVGNSSEQILKLISNNQTQSLDLGYYYINKTAGSSLEFHFDGSEKARIDSSGNLLVGKTSGALGTAGSAFYNYGLVESVRDGNKVMTLNRLTSDGDILDFRKDGTTVGSIRAEGSGTGFTLKAAASNGYVAFHANNQSTGIFFEDATTKRLAPYSSRDNEFDLGGSSRRWKDLYLSGGVYLGGTGSANHLDDYEEGTFQSTLTPRTSGTITLLTAYDVLSYTKVGRAVTVTGDLVVSSLSSPVGASIELSLPFTIANLSELSGRVGGAVSYYDASVARTTKPYVGLEGTDYILVTLDPSTLASSDSITFSVTYFTT
jgi:hypothetical protein